MSPAAIAWVFLGGGVGASLRFITINLIAKAGIVLAFPFAVLLINIFGSFAIGVLAQIVSRETIANPFFIQNFVMIGILGGFTTFSAFSIEALTLLQAGKVGAAAFYVAASVAFSIIAAYLGYVIAK